MSERQAYVAFRDMVDGPVPESDFNIVLNEEVDALTEYARRENRRPSRGDVIQDAVENMADAYRSGPPASFVSADPVDWTEVARYVAAHRPVAVWVAVLAMRDTRRGR